MSFTFELPLNRDDLLRQSGVNHYVVEDVHPLRIIPSKLQAMQMALRAQGPVCLLQHFDTLYSVLKHWHSVAPEVKEDSWNLLVKVVSSLGSRLVEALDSVGSNTELRLKNLNVLKMSVYLLCQFIESLEGDASKAAAAGAVKKPGKGRKKAERDSVAKAFGDIDWVCEREKALRYLLQILQLNIHTLWDPPVMEEEFVNLVTCCSYKLLENQDVVKDKQLRDTLFHLLGVMVKKYNHALGCSLKILQLLQHFDHLTSHLAQAVQLFATEYGAKTITGEIMREIGRMDTRDLARDSSGTRAYAAFLVELAARIPDVMLPSISVLLPLLDKEPYSMRNSILGVLGEICVQVLTKENLDAQQKSTRDQFLDKLEDHIRDVNAFARSKCLQIWLHIVSEKALPLTRQHQLMELVIGRLQDKSSQVRKYAIQLTTTLLKCNPFAAKLSLDELRVNYEKEKEKLAEITPPPPQETPLDLAKKGLETEWRRLEDLITAALQDSVSADDEESTDESEIIPEDDTMEIVKGRVVTLLRDNNMKEAIRLVRAARGAFPADPVFTPPDSLTISDDDMDEADDDDQQKQAMLHCLKAVFFGELLQSAVIEGAVSLAAGDLPMNPASPGAASSHDASLVNEVAKQQVLVQYLKDSMNFVAQIQKAVPVISLLLGSKNVSDVLEAIQFFVTGFRFGVSNSMLGIRRMLVLVWSKEQTVKDAVVSAYRDLYIQSDETTNPRVRALSVVNNLTELLVGATYGDLTSMEAMVCEFVRTGDLDSNVIQLLWERFALKIPNSTEQQSRTALMLLGMAAGAEMEIARSNVDVLVKEGLGVRGESDLQLVRETCVVLSKLAPPQKTKPGVTSEPFRFPKDHDMFTRLAFLLTSSVGRFDSSNWMSMAEQAINVIYTLAEHPDVIAADIIKHIATVLKNCCVATAGCLDNMDADGDAVVAESGDDPAKEQSPTNTDGIVTRLLSVAGHIALRQLVHADVAVLGEMKRRNAIQEGSKPDNKGKKKANKTTTSADETASTSKKNKEVLSADEEEEMGLAGATADDAETEFINRITETEVVTGDSLLCLLKPLLVTVCSNPSRYPDVELQAAASLALAKYMLVSSEFCEEHLQLLFTILEKSSHAIIRANTIIAMGDLAFRFPNLIEPWTPNLYARLRDDSPLVRKNTLMVLTHLILNDMIKVKGQISELATCIVDDNERISGLSKLFFHELARKGNAIYNIMPDMVSRLSDTEVGVTEDHFRTIMRHLFSFIQKDRQCESLVEKLCQRFRVTNEPRQWRDIAFCLSLMSFNEKALRKLQEKLPCFADKMADEDIYGSFTTVLSGAKKFAKQETKALVEELEQCFEQCHNKGVEDEDAAQQASQAHKASTKTPGKRGRAMKAKTPGRRQRKTSDDPNKSDFLDTPLADQRCKKKQGKKPTPSFDSDEDSDVDMFQFDERSPARAPPRSEPVRKSDAENDDPNISFDSPGHRPLKKRHHSQVKSGRVTRVRHKGNA